MPSIARLLTHAAAILLLMLAISGCGSRDTPDTTPVEPVEIESATVEEAESAEIVPPEPEAPTREPEMIAAHLETLDPIPKLGGRLFFDSRMSNPGANLAASCRTCHVPPFLSDGQQLYSDSVPLSVLPANSTGGKITSRRNAPTLQDTTSLEQLNWDGRHTDVDAFLWDKLISVHMGWEEGQEEQARNEIHALMFNDQGEDAYADGSYIEQFKSALGFDVETAEQQDVLNAVVQCLRAFLDTIHTTKTSGYDAFAFLNRLNEGLTDPTDTPEELSGRIFGRISNQEGRVLIRFPNVFNESAYQGYKTFMRFGPTYSTVTLETETSVGACVMCHVPPMFTDGRFHNTGVTQLAYDAEHGDGTFMELDPANVEGADLGRYAIDPQEGTLAAFRTPGLRNVEMTAPYNHDGGQRSLEEVIRHKIRISELAKAGKLRNPHPAFLAMNLTDADVPNLIAFLKTLSEVPEEEYRDFRIENVRIRRDPDVEEQIERQ